MTYGFKVFVQSVNPIWIKRMHHMHFFNKFFFVKKVWKCGYLFFFGSIFFPHFTFFWFFFQSIFFWFVFILFALFINNHTSWRRDGSEYLLWWLCIGVCICWFNKCWAFKPWFKSMKWTKYALFVIMCEFMWRKKWILELLKANVDSHIGCHPIYFSKKEKQFSFYCCFKPQRVTILWGQQLRIPFNFNFQKKRKKWLFYYCV
jgi:hypothetical protein